MNKQTEDDFLRKVLITIGAVLATVILVCLVIYAADVFLLLFSGILFAVFLRGVGGWIEQHTRFSQKFSIFVVLVILILILILSFRAFIPTISLQMTQLSETLPISLQKTSTELSKVDWIRFVAKYMNQHYLFPNSEILIGKTAPVISNMFGSLLGFFIMMIIGFYFSINSGTYLGGVLRFIPVYKRHRVSDFFGDAEIKLRGWLFGQFFDMLSVGIMTTIGLSFLKVPLAFILGLIAGLLTFIPTFGLILSMIPAVVVAFAQDPQLAVYVVILYLGAHFIDSYFLSPWIQFHAVSLPPLLVIFPQVLIGSLFGFLGLALATPLTLVVLIFFKYFYIEDVLGDFGQAETD
jgi:predicted PurR-regulated permease PerM